MGVMGPYLYSGVCNPHSFVCPIKVNDIWTALALKNPWLVLGYYPCKPAVTDQIDSPNGGHVFSPEDRALMAGLFRGHN